MQAVVVFHTNRALITPKVMYLCNVILNNTYLPHVHIFTVYSIIQEEQVRVVAVIETLRSENAAAILLTL